MPSAWRDVSFHFTGSETGTPPEPNFSTSQRGLFTINHDVTPPYFSIDSKTNVGQVADLGKLAQAIAEFEVEKANGSGPNDPEDGLKNCGSIGPVTYNSSTDTIKIGNASDSPVLPFDRAVALKDSVVAKGLAAAPVLP